MGRGRKRSKREEEDDEEEFDDKRKKGSVYFELSASESENGDEEGDYDDDEDDGFFVDTVEDIPDENEVGGDRVRRPPLVSRRDEEEVDVETMEKMVYERYGSKYSTSYDDDDFEDEFTELEEQALLPSFKDPKLWLVKCVPGREKEVAALLMQKSLDKGSNSQVFSAIALDHLKNYIYVEAHNVASVIQACKGIHNVFARNITMVPMKEMSNVLSVEHKAVHLYRGDWVRLKRTSHKGELAKVVDVDDVKRKVTVKVIPKLGAPSLSENMEGADYLYKTVALSSVSQSNIYPSIQEVENLQEIGEATAEMATLFKGKDKGCWMRGDVVVVVKGELKNLKGSIEFVEGDIVHIRPNDEKISLKTIAVHKRDLAKYFEPGCHVKVVCGRHEGATGMVVKVDRDKLVIVSDAVKDHITVFSEQVIESKEISYSSPKEGMISNNIQPIQERYKNSLGSQRVPQSLSSCNLQPGSRPSPPLGRRTGHTGKRHDSFIGCKVKILHGPYRGYRGCVKGVNGQNVRVELEAQMNTITVDRSHISEKLTVSNTSYMPQQRTGGETPSHPRTPLVSMEGETPWRSTPFRSPRPTTPILHGSAQEHLLSNTAGIYLH